MIAPSDPAETAWRPSAGGIEVRVRLTPKSSHDRIDGIEQTADGPAVKARVRAVPEDGKANAALEVLVATWLGVPKRSVAVTSGGKSRVKTLTIAGASAELSSKLTEALDATAAAAAGGRGKR